MEIETLRSRVAELLDTQSAQDIHVHSLAACKQALTGIKAYMYAHLWPTDQNAAVTFLCSHSSMIAQDELTEELA